MPPRGAGGTSRAGLRAACRAPAAERARSGTAAGRMRSPRRAPRTARALRSAGAGVFTPAAARTRERRTVLRRQDGCEVAGPQDPAGPLVTLRGRCPAHGVTGHLGGAAARDCRFPGQGLRTLLPQRVLPSFSPWFSCQRAGLQRSLCLHWVRTPPPSCPSPGRPCRAP